MSNKKTLDEVLNELRLEAEQLAKNGRKDLAKQTQSKINRITARAAKDPHSKEKNEDRG